MHGVCDVELNQTIFDGYCYFFQSNQISSFPSMQIELKNVELVLPPSNYILANDTNSNTFCLGVLNTGERGLTIIGDSLMLPYVTIFDNVNEQLGFASVNSKTCKYKP